MGFIYDAAYFVFAAVYLPVFLSKARQAESFRDLLKERCGFLAEGLKTSCSLRPVIWLHAVSVGEVMAVRNFLAGLLERFPEAHVVLTTVTPTGQKLAKAAACERVSVVYFPFDFGWACRRFFNVLKPRCLFLAETEIWPNLLAEARKAGVPVGILNGRLSARSAARYKQYGFFFRPLAGVLSFVLAQTEEDAKRFGEIGVVRERIHVLGNMKFDNVVLKEENGAKEALKEAWGFKPGDRIWIAGSTHPGEEQMAARIFLRLKARFGALKLILAPRHIERSPKLAEEIGRLGVGVRLASDSSVRRDSEVLILNQLGILRELYQLADVVFMGGSFVRRGGQNPLEAAAFQKAVLHGPHVFNFEKVYRDLDSRQAAFEVPEETALETRATELLEDEALRDQAGRRAFDYVGSLRGATRRHLDWVSLFLTSQSKERKKDVAPAKLFQEVSRKS